MNFHPTCINQPVRPLFGDSSWLHPASAAVTSPKWRLSFKLASCSRLDHGRHSMDMVDMVDDFASLTIETLDNSENSDTLNFWLQRLSGFYITPDLTEVFYIPWGDHNFDLPERQDCCPMGQPNEPQHLACLSTVWLFPSSFKPKQASSELYS